MNKGSFLDDLTEDNISSTQEIFVMADKEDQELNVQCSLVSDETKINRNIQRVIQCKYFYESIIILFILNNFLRKIKYLTNSKYSSFH